MELSGAKEMGTGPTSLAPILGEFAWFWARTHRRDSCVLARGVRTSSARLLHARIRVFGAYVASFPDFCKHRSGFLVLNSINVVAVNLAQEWGELTKNA